jgi:hypothetical protein
MHMFDVVVEYSVLGLSAALITGVRHMLLHHELLIECCRAGIPKLFRWC